MKLVVNGDDAAYCPERTRGIVGAFTRGVLTSTTVLMNTAFTGQTRDGWLEVKM